MSIGHALLGSQENGSRHRYDLKRAYDERFGHCRSLAFGQVYATLSRLCRDGLVDMDAVEPGAGWPKRTRYSITDGEVMLSAPPISNSAHESRGSSDVRGRTNNSPSTTCSSTSRLTYDGSNSPGRASTTSSRRSRHDCCPWGSAARH